MRLLHLIPLLPVAIPATCATTSPSPSFDPQPYSSAPFSFPHYAHRAHQHKSLFAQWRDRAVQLVWEAPRQAARDAVDRLSSLGDGNIPTSWPTQYGGDVVLRFRIQSEAESAALAEAVTVLFLDVWEFTAEWADIRLSKRVVPSLLGLLPSSLQRAHTPLMYDLTQAIFESYPSHPSDEPRHPKPERYRTFSPALHAPAEETNVFFRNYQPLSVLVPWMRLLTSLFPTHVRMFSLGLTPEGRDIHALRVGVHPTNSEQPSAPRKTIIIAGGSHAREWISTSTVAYVAYSLITEYGKFPAVTRLLEEFDWVFIPTLNPDGYVYTWETDRLWRKNRQQTSLRFCKGIDIDRGFGFEWDNDPDRNNPCSEAFSGDAPFEAVESRHLANWVRNETDHGRVRIVGFLDLHSYSQQVLYPYSYSCTSSPPSLENLEELAMGLAKAIRLTSGVQYGVTSACEGSVTMGDRKQPPSRWRPRNRDSVWPRMETGGGSALDWFYHEIGVRYAYQIKLRDTGSYGFLLPSSDIVPTGKEFLSAVRYFGDFLHSNKAMGEKGGDDRPEGYDGEGEAGAAKLAWEGTARGQSVEKGQDESWDEDDEGDEDEEDEEDEEEDKEEDEEKKKEEKEMEEDEDENQEEEEDQEEEENSNNHDHKGEHHQDEKANEDVKEPEKNEEEYPHEL